MHMFSGSSGGVQGVRRTVWMFWHEDHNTLQQVSGGTFGLAGDSLGIEGEFMYVWGADGWLVALLWVVFVSRIID